MNWKKISIAILIVLVVLFLICSPASARTSDNTGVQNNDRIYTGETGLNFSAFTFETGGHTYVPDEMRTADGLYSIPLTAMCKLDGTILQGMSGKKYYPYNATYGGIYNSESCTVEDLNIGILNVKPYYHDTTVVWPDAIQKGAEIIFYISDSTIAYSQLNGIWNRMTITSDSTGSVLYDVKNLDGLTQSLTGIANPSDSSNKNYAFRFSDQPAAYIPAGESKITVKYTVYFNGINKEIQYGLTLHQSEFKIEGATISQGSTAGLAFTGIPFYTYDVTLDEGMNVPIFVTGENIVKITDSHILVTPGWEGTVRIPVYVPENAPEESYEITAAGGGLSCRNYIKVTENTKKLIFNDLPSDALKGLFAEGDSIYLNGKVSGTSEDVPVYLSITGPNLPENGMSLDGKTAVVDGDNSTFTVVMYSVILEKWEYMWRTIGFEPATYTIHANLEPVGYIKSSTPGENGYETRVSKSISVSDPSLHFKAYETNSGYFAQGDEIKFEIRTRGSPGSDGGTRGMIHWYIIGQNFRWTNTFSFPLVENIDDFGKTAPIAPDSSKKIKAERTFSNNLDPGTYYILVQHSGPDGKYDAKPDISSGPFTQIITASGKTQNIGALQGDNSAYALTQLIASSYSDDLYVISKLVIETPVIKITQPQNLKIGDKLIICGTTNYCEDDFFRLQIRKIDYSDPDNNMAMIIPVQDLIHPGSVSPYESQMKRPFSFDEIDTSTWFPGTYEATVTNDDTGKSQTITFTIDGTSGSTSVELTQKTDPALSADNTGYQQSYGYEYDDEYWDPEWGLQPDGDTEYNDVSRQENTGYDDYDYTTAPTSVSAKTTSGKTKSPGFAALAIPALCAALLIYRRR